MAVFTTVVGVIAALLVLVSQLPQLYKSIKTKQTGDLSLGTILLLIAGAATWLLYGLLRADQIIIFANIIMLAIVTILLTAKIRYK